MGKSGLIDALSGKDWMLVSLRKYREVCQPYCNNPKRQWGGLAVATINGAVASAAELGGCAFVRLRCMVTRAREKDVGHHWYEITSRVAGRTEIFQHIRMVVVPMSRVRT